VVRQKERSEALDRLPRFAELLRRGEIDLRRLEAVDERVVNLPNQAMITQVEDALVDIAPGLTRTQLARRATKAVAQVDPTGYDQRRQKAKEDRRVEFVPLPDGMAELRIRLTAIDARAAYDVLTQDAQSCPKTSGPPTRNGQMRSWIDFWDMGWIGRFGCMSPSRWRP